MAASYDTLRAEAEHALAKARRALDQEISDYPVPISGCDAQFNHLLAGRQRLRAAMTELKAQVFIPTPRSPSPSSGVESR